jgi:hypothetical protein
MTAAAGAVAQEPPGTTRLYRFIQGGTEVGRETYRHTAGATERSVVVPLLALKLDSRAEYDASSRFARFEARVFNAAGDSLRATYTLEQRGDSLVVTTVAGERTRTRTIAGRPDGVVPVQSVSVIAEAVERAAGRDTTFRFLPMGLDTLIAIAVHFAGDTAIVTTAGIPAHLSRTGAGAIEITAQRLVADVWNGRDSLPVLAGLHRPHVDYAAPSGATYTAEEVRVPVRYSANDTFSLGCTLTRPSGPAGRLPVAVTLTGSGSQTRDEDIWPLLADYRPFRQVAERLAQAGIGSLRCDDRGVGASGGGDTTVTTPVFARDLGQVIAWLRARPDVDGRRVAVIGHSEGGLTGPLAAVEDPRIAAVVIMAGPGKVGRDILRDQFTRPIQTAPGLPDEERQRLLASIEGRIDEWTNANAWTRWFATFDPLPLARRLRQPVLIVHGALDRQVSVGQADTLGAAIRAGGNRDVTVRIFPRLNHLFLPTDGDGSPAEYMGLRQTQVPAEVLDSVATWLGARLRR